jgi:D-glycero-D-manno-heptose 1,7-bisphosphate phosphatase
MNFAARAVFLDRDGVINEKAPEGSYIMSADQFVVLPGAVEAIARLTRNDLLVFVVTNQRCIGKGIATVEDVAEIHERLSQAVADAGGRIEQIYVCPHDYKDACLCRKPKPGMLLQAAREHSLTLSECWMIGDSMSDVSAGREAGCRTVLVDATHTGNADITADSLSDAVDKILAKLSAGAIGS